MSLVSDSVLTSSSALPGSPVQDSVFDPQMCLALRTFLQKVADSPLKVRILQMFLLQSGVCLSSAQLAERIDGSLNKVREALQQLNDAGALTFCSCFGNGDLCLMNPNYHTSAMKRDLALLLRALRVDSTRVWQFFETPDFQR